MFFKKTTDLICNVSTYNRLLLQALRELKAKAQQKGAFGGSGLKKSGKKWSCSIGIGLDFSFFVTMLLCSLVPNIQIEHVWLILLIDVQCLSSLQEPLNIRFNIFWILINERWLHLNFSLGLMSWGSPLRFNLPWSICNLSFKLILKVSILKK